MTKISLLPNDSAPTGADILAGVENSNDTTSNFKLSDLSNFFENSELNNWPALFAGVSAAFSLSNSGNIVSVSGTLQPGKYLVIAKTSCNPSGGQNAGAQITATGGTIGFGYRSAAIHSSDADYSTTKWLHRTIFDYLTVTTAGTVTVNLYLAADASGTFNFCQASDPRWASYIAVLPA